MAQFEIRELLQLVRSPMTVVERTAAPQLEGITSLGNVPRMMQGRSLDGFLEDLFGQIAQAFLVLFHPLEKFTITNEGHLDRFDQPGAASFNRLGVKEAKIIHHRVWHGEGSDKIFLTKGIDAVLHSHPTVILGEGRGREADQTDPAVSGRGGKADDIQKRSSSNHHHVGMAVDAVLLNGRHRGLVDPVIALGFLASREPLDSGEPQSGNIRKIILNFPFQLREKLAQSGLGKNEHLAPPRRLQQPGHQSIGRRKSVPRKPNPVPKAHLNLEILSAHPFGETNVHTPLGQPFLGLYPQKMPEIISHHEGRYLSLREIDDWEFATRPNATGVVGIFALTTENEVILVEQFRRPVQSRVLEICAGLIGDEEEFPGESIADCAARELLEETGYRPERISPLLSSPTSAGMTDETTHLFFAEGCNKVAAGGGVGTEDITTHLVPFDELGEFLSLAPEKGLLVDFKIHACLGMIGLK